MQIGYKKMLKSINHQKNAKKHTKRHHFISVRWLSSKRQQITNIGKDMVKRKPLYVYCWWECNMVQPYRQQYGTSSKTQSGASLVVQWLRICRCRGHGFDPWPRKIQNAAEQQSPCATSIEPMLNHLILFSSHLQPFPASGSFQ